MAAPQERCLGAQARVPVGAEPGEERECGEASRDGQGGDRLEHGKGDEPVERTAREHERYPEPHTGQQGIERVVTKVGEELRTEEGLAGWREIPARCPSGMKTAQSSARPIARRNDWMRRYGWMRRPRCARWRTGKTKDARNYPSMKSV